MRTFLALFLFLYSLDEARADQPSADFLNAVVACEWCAKHTVKDYAAHGFGAGVKTSWKKVDANTWILVAEVVDPMTKKTDTIKLLFGAKGKIAVVGGVMLGDERADPRTAAGVQQGLAANIDKSK